MIDTNQNKEIEFSAFVGIDWADLKHVRLLARIVCRPELKGPENWSRHFSPHHALCQWVVTKYLGSVPIPDRIILISPL